MFPEVMTSSKHFQLNKHTHLLAQNNTVLTILSRKIVVLLTLRDTWQMKLILKSPVSTLDWHDWSSDLNHAERKSWVGAAPIKDDQIRMFG